VLLQERARAGAEALRAQEVATRVGIARDLHDVLAHSLGGLVVQLDAVEALLDAGDVDTAATRVTAARRLAVEGLHEAREAVRTLRGAEPWSAPRESAPGDSAPVGVVPDAGSTLPADLAGRLQTLIAAHEGIGAHAQLQVSGVPRPVPAALAEALSRAVQEALSNARKHAPGSAVQVGLIWHPDRVECVIENRIRPDAGSSGGSGAAPSAGELAATGGGYGLRGVRERFAALGGTVQVGTVPVGTVQVAEVQVGTVPDETVPAGTEPAGASIPSTGAGTEMFVLRVEAPA
jgi:signal transduction histidine kinase